MSLLRVVRLSPLVGVLVLQLAGCGSHATVADSTSNSPSSELTASPQAEGTGPPDADSARRVEHIRHIARRSALFGLAVLAVGVTLLFIYGYIRDWAAAVSSITARRPWFSQVELTGARPSASAGAMLQRWLTTSNSSSRCRAVARWTVTSARIRR